jgi:hypothetical protein
MALGIKNTTISITTLSITALDTVMLSVANKHIRLSVIMLRVEAPFYNTQNNITQQNGTRPYIKMRQHSALQQLVLLC